MLVTLALLSAPLFSFTVSAFDVVAEPHLQNLRPLTLSGMNSDAHWSPDGRWLVFQSRGTPGAEDCDQIFRIRANDGKGLQRLSGGRGRATSPSYYPDGQHVLFSSTAQASAACPPPPPAGVGRVWAIPPTNQLYSVKSDASDSFPVEPASPSLYNAEASVCHDGSVVFTSTRNGEDPELYVAKLDRLGTLNDVKRVTNSPGYDGGASFSPDCRQIVWRASRPRMTDEVEDYQRLLGMNLVRPQALDLWIAQADGSAARQLTELKASAMAPVFTPDGSRILFASDHLDPASMKFDLYLIRTNGTGLERVTFSGDYNGSPSFSPDGKKLVFSSDRLTKKSTDLFVADWVNAGAPDPREHSEADSALELIEKLSTPSMEGRGLGTRGLHKAEELVASEFAKAGLHPLSEMIQTAEVDGFFQKVEIRDPSQTLAAKTFTARNVVGLLGDSCGKKTPLVIGAHLDHLGMGGEGSLEPSKSGLHPGADDNASGVAGVLAAARRLAAEADFVRGRCAVIAAFTGEEIGIAGSSKLAELFEKSRVHPSAMFNLDMIGRMLSDKLIIFGTDTAKEWRAWVDQACAAHHLECPGGGDGYGPSDHMAFYLKKIPVLHLFTGPHLDYHRTTDTAEKINATGIVQTAELVVELAKRVTARGAHLHYVKASSAPSMGSLSLHGKKSHGAYLGTIPDYSSMTSPHGPSGAGEPGGGVKLAGVRPGSPADKAGVRAGDVLLSIGDRKIATLEQFMGILMDLKPEDAVALHLRRDGKDLALPATIGKRE